MNLGRIMIFENPDDHPYLQDDYCKGMPAMDACYLLPVSKCAAGLEVPATEDILALNYSDPSQGEHKFLFERMGYVGDRKGVPHMFNAMLEASTIPKSKRYYWWRSQAAAYVVRLNDRSLDQLRQLREELFPGKDSLRNAISVHIRRGDKWKEAAPTNDTSYDLAANFLYEESLSEDCDPSTCLNRELFISTEDVTALDYFVNHTDWGVRYTDNPALLKPDKKMWAHEYAFKVGPSKDMLGSMLNLQLALECSAWVGTASSNWCRLIDQMRATVACKAHLPFVDPTEPEQSRIHLGP
mmetsp:Transcript_14529/g.43906  ORF Transcript_14529/g.43906 Transcript_14529/m.43906 type:complete len:297 (+) Transcript_14529:780-1670(+)